MEVTISNNSKGKHIFPRMDEKLPASLDLNVGDTPVLLEPEIFGTCFHADGLPNEQFEVEKRMQMVGAMLPGQPKNRTIHVFTARSSGNGSFRVINLSVKPYRPFIGEQIIRYTVS